MRHGTIDLVRGAEPGHRGRHPPPHRPPPRCQVPKFLKLIDRTVAAGLTVHVVLANSSTHKTPSMNLVERWFAAITKQIRFRTRVDLRCLYFARYRAANANPTLDS
jgi:hypothetical protein